ncbi:Indolepyruvate ferredoxin oxidoreductase [Alkaliphilus metalliredigens QYMF]|uniref:Indolepyruvate oxidoreductase subunit IorA n=1 Tax=Alkaliphilus metalliredigens (strain QYMF) TaxID=293826 RepID=A6TNS0_ALKMQ|nr:thiamine pyrophosphate-dependent enzyme [Alkaliphilus metalliredigens]ABR47838.1 Indolepyruvate ferredoxin oxidoreductase [Alkaliphilus metalliredigens QYMF]
MSSQSKGVLTGNEALVRGFYEAGGLVAASYPGSPTVEVLETIKSYEGVYAEFSTNEKVALEVAIGGSFTGARSMAVMKHVGMNIASDPLMTFTETPIRGGFVLVSGDDPGMASSQNEQDNRLFAKFANMAILSPGNSQEAKDYTKLAFSLSEDFQLPTLLNITSRVCHSRSVVTMGEREEHAPTGFDLDPVKYAMIPKNTYQAQYFMKDRLEKLQEYAYDCPVNQLEEKDGATILVIASGLMYYNLKEIDPPVSIYKLGLTYPLSIKRIKELSEQYDEIIVLEEMMPFIENELKIHGIPCSGKSYFSFTGELNSEEIAEGLYKAGVLKKKIDRAEKTAAVARPPLFCSGCPHRPIFDILKKSKVKIMGDIGCYSLAAQAPFNGSSSIISMGASIGITKGVQKALALKEDPKPLVAVIGDGTFFHSGIPGFINLLHQADDKDNLTIIILDNRTTAMTGGQSNASSGHYNLADDMNIDIESLIKTIGFKQVVMVDQFKYDEAKKVINNEIKRPGISIVIATRPCALKYKIKEPHFYVDPSICIGCRSCVNTNCPPIRMKEYKDYDKLKSSIDANMCVGCSICAQVCPVNAIKRSESD